MVGLIIFICYIGLNLKIYISYDVYVHEIWIDLKWVWQVYHVQKNMT